MNRCNEFGSITTGNDSIGAFGFRVNVLRRTSTRSIEELGDIGHRTFNMPGLIHLLTFVFSIFRAKIESTPCGGCFINLTFLSTKEIEDLWALPVLTPRWPFESPVTTTFSNQIYHSIEIIGHSSPLGTEHSKSSRKSIGISTKIIPRPRGTARARYRSP